MNNTPNKTNTVEEVARLKKDLEHLRNENAFLQLIGGELVLYHVLEKISEEIIKIENIESFIFAFKDYEDENLIIEKMCFVDKYRGIESFRLKSIYPSNENDFITAGYLTNKNIYISENELNEYPNITKNFFETYNIKHCVSLPISRGNEVIGVLSIMNHQNEIERKIIGEIQDIINKYFKHIKNSLIFTRLKEKQEEIKKNIKINEKYTKIVERLNDLNTIEKVYEIFIKELLKLFNFNLGFILLEEQGDLIYKAGYISDQKFTNYMNEIENLFSNYSLQIKTSTSFPVECYSKKNHIYIPDIQKVTNITKSIIDNQFLSVIENAKTGIILPILYHKKPIGVIELLSFKTTVNLNDTDISLLKFLGVSLGTSISNANIFTVIENQKQTIASTNAELESLNEITKQISRTLDVRSVFYTVFDYLKSRYGFNGTHLNLITDDKEHFIVEIAEYPGFLKLFEKEVQDHVYSLNEEKGPTVDCIRKNKIFYFSNIDSEKLEEGINKRMTELLKIQSLLHIPIDTGEEVIGSFLLMCHEKTVLLNESDIKSIERFVNQIAVIIKNAKLHDEIKKSKEEINSINEFSRQISMSLDFRNVLINIFQYLKDKYGFNGNNLNLVNNDNTHYTIDIVESPKEFQHHAKKIQGIKLPLDETGGRVADCIRKNKTFYFTDINPKNIKDPANREMTKDFNIKTILHIPINIAGEIIGSFSLMSHGKSIYLTNKDIESIKRFVNQIAIILRNSKLYEEIKIKINELEKKDKAISQDLSLAKKIQTNILTQDYKKIKELDFHIVFEPMMQVGGDIYDIFEVKPNYYRILIVDAIGHGVQAAMATMIIKSEYDKIKVFDMLPSYIINLFNNTFMKTYENVNIYFTCAIVDVDINNDKLIYSAAGHPDQFLIINKKLVRLHRSGPMIGLIKDYEFEYETFNFPAFSKCLLFSDGIYEEYNKKKKNEYGDKRLEGLINDLKLNNINVICENIVQNVKKWLDGEPNTDDITLIAFERK